MKKFKFFLQVLFFSSFINQISYPQFVLNSSYNPAPGDSSITIEVDTTGITPGSGGENQIWNYSNIIQSGTPEIENFVIPSITPYFSQFPNSNVASVHHIQPSNYYHYFQASDTSLSILGYASEGVLMNFICPFLRFHYPLSYGTQLSRVYNGILYNGNSILNMWGTISITCDGYGTIILPSETIYNVLRLKFINEEYDTTRIGGVVVQIEHVIYTSYVWYREGYKFQVFSYTEIQSTIYGFRKSINISLKNSPIGIKEVSERIPEQYSLFQNYPNPFNPVTRIKYELPITNYVKLIVYDILGKGIKVLVDEIQRAGRYEVTWDASNLPSGIYFYKIETGKYVLTRKMVLLK